MLKQLLRLLLNYFIKGAIFLLPLVGAIALLFWAISSIDAALNISGQLWTDPTGRPVYIPGLGILTVLLILVFAGFLVTRSEEHTSELQSRENLVCRLLLEKKNRTARAS